MEGKTAYFSNNGRQQLPVTHVTYRICFVFRMGKGWGYNALLYEFDCHCQMTVSQYNRMWSVF